MRFQLRVPIEQILNSFSANLIMNQLFNLLLIMDLIALVNRVISIIDVLSLRRCMLLLDLVQYLFLLCLQIPQHGLLHMRII